jgi:hypothetical protein
VWPTPVWPPSGITRCICPATGGDAGEGEAALERAGALVAIPNAGGRYSTRFLPDPDAVPRLKDALGRAIEGLSQ